MTVSTGPVSLVMCGIGWLYCIICVTAYYQQMPMEIQLQATRSAEKDDTAAAKSPFIQTNVISRTAQAQMKSVYV